MKMKPRSLGLLKNALALVALISCHHSPRVELTLARQTHCWWTSEYVAQRPTLVAWAFERAFANAGFSNARSQANADSAWATAGPAHIGQTASNAQYAFRVVAYSARDSVSCAWRGAPQADAVRRPAGAESCFHTNLFIYRPQKGWTESDSVAASDRVLPLCGDIYKAAMPQLERVK